MKSRLKLQHTAYSKETKNLLNNNHPGIKYVDLCQKETDTISVDVSEFPLLMLKYCRPHLLTPTVIFISNK